MKKTLLMAGLCLFMLTGCGNKVTCTGEVEEDGVAVTMELNAKFDGDTFESAEAVMEFSDETSAQSFCGLLEMANGLAESEEEKIKFECDDKKIIFDDYAAMLETGDEELDLKKLTKDEFIEMMEDQDLTCKK